VISGVLQNASWLVTDRMAGTSQGAFAFNNLAVHVGDDPECVAANRADLQERIGAPIVFTRAAHSRRVAYVQTPVADVAGVDALITDRPGLALAAQGADCVMLAIAAGPWIAAVHCGWRGLVDGVVPETLAALAAGGADLASAEAHLGPAICGRCYLVDAARARQVGLVAPEAVVASPDATGVDVRAGVMAQLQRAGIVATVDPRCTAEDTSLYSYRRDGTTGRQAIVIVKGAA